MALHFLYRIHVPAEDRDDGRRWLSQLYGVPNGARVAVDVSAREFWTHDVVQAIREVSRRAVVQVEASNPRVLETWRSVLVEEEVEAK